MHQGARPAMPRSTLFLDNGGYTVKALYLPAPQTDAAQPSSSGLSTSSGNSMPRPKVFIMPNCVGAAPHAGSGIMGDQLTRLPHYHGLMVRRPVDRGFVVDGGLQARIWEHVLQHFTIEQEEEVDVWLTVPFGAPKAVAQLLWLLCTRGFCFGSVTVISSSFLSLIAYSFPAVSPVTGSKGHASAGDSSLVQKGATQRTRKRPRHEDSIEENAEGVDSVNCNRGGTAIVVDVGFSGTTVVPYMDFLPVVSSIVRLDVGGKLLTNRLKEFLSFRQVNVMEDTWLVNAVRERCCVVAPQPWRSLRRYAVLWKGKTREALEATLSQENNTLKSSHSSNNGMGVSAVMSRRGVRRSETSSGLPVDKEAGEKTLDVLSINATTAAAADTPVRFYLPTIPALFPLGVLESELPSRLPKATAVDPAALQHLLLCQERFLIPELLFAPGDVGLDQQGLPQVITEGVFQRGLLQHVVTLLRPQLLKRVCVYGGVADTPLLLARLHHEVRAVTTQVAWDTEHFSSNSNDKRGTKSAAASHELHSGGVEAPPPVPALLADAIAAAAAAADLDSVSSSTSPASSHFSAMSLQPLIGAFYLLTADATSNSASAQRLAQLRTLAQQRSKMELQHPASGRVTVETFQEAMRHAL